MLGSGRQTSSARAGRNFGLVVGIALVAYAGRLILRGRFGVAARPLMALGLLLVTLAIASPAALIIPARLWLGLTAALSFVSTRLILGLVFFGVVTPIALVKRWLGWDPLRRRSSSSPSYWGRYTQRQQDSRHYEKMF
jgi:hypothetical protein